MSAILAVVGATGTGKSGFALDVADEILDAGGRAEVINADAMQLYRGMDIGTAKLSVGERRGVPHHLLDVLEVTDEASVARYQGGARAAIIDVLDRGAVPILVGGSGLYVSSVLFDFQFPGTDPCVRARLEAELDANGPNALYERLEELDAPTAEQIGSTNGRRIVRAIEVIEITGRPQAARLPEEPMLWRDVKITMLTAARTTLVERLDTRVGEMWDVGLLEEVRGLLPAGLERGITARRAIGYAQALAEIAGEVSRDEAIADTQRLTRTYARRQVGWFRRYREAVAVDGADAAALRARARGLAHLD